MHEGRLVTLRNPNSRCVRMK